MAELKIPPAAVGALLGGTVAEIIAITKIDADGTSQPIVDSEATSVEVSPSDTFEPADLIEPIGIVGGGALVGALAVTALMRIVKR